MLFFKINQKKLLICFVCLFFSPSGNHHLVHSEEDQLSNHHYTISSQNTVLSQNDISSLNDTNDKNNISVSASKIKWIDAVRTVKQINQVRLCSLLFYLCFINRIND